ncbi:MAG: glycosyltransferase [Anaerolineae bacterium]|nr:glycosyltransferase [Anaerolineae bacterium]NIN97439.1 glycosyltransferase [Anaerolineae bacterium]NIQ80371.1 glycosyltransferase [Anaerolineae bacterium]
MRILQVSTSDISGGAAKSAHRLHRGLLQLGYECRMLVRHKLSTDDSVFAVNPVNLEETFDEELLLGTVVQDHYINSHRTDVSNTLFSLPYPGYDLSTLPLVQAADVINLHWVAYYQSPITLHRLLNLGKPVVWTLHDHWPFTGGCHVATGCDNYREDCRACPQLADDPLDLPKAVLGDKLALLPGENLTIVAPSRWLATRASGSRLFKDRHVQVIPNSVETDLYRPLPKAQARESLGLPAESIVLLFGATDVREKLKGFRELQDATQYCLTHPEFDRLVESEKIRLLCFGHGSDELKVGRIPVASLGYVTSDERMASTYAAADIFVLPSLEDNLPNTMLEAMSCGVPVVAFDAGGIPEVIVNGATGQLAPVDDVRRLGEAMLSLIFDPSRREAMGENCRKTMLEGYTLDAQALRYRELYGDLQKHRQPRARRTSWDSAIEQDQQQTVGEASAADTLPVRLEAGLGPRFEGIYEHVLSKALREFASAREKAYQESEADRADRLRQVNRLTELLEESEADRAARLEQVHELTKLLQESESDRTARLEQIHELTQLLQESEADRAARLEQIHELTKLLQESEGDRTARLEQIHELTQLLQESEADRAARLEQVHELTGLLEESETDRAARLEVIRNQEARISQLEDELRLLESHVEVRLRRRLSRLLGNGS